MATSDFTIDYWHFDLPQYGQMFASGGKMIVRNPRNQVVFDSRMKYLKIQDFYTPDLKSTSDDVRTYPRLPAIVCVNRSWGHVQQPMTQFQTRIEDISSCGWTDGNTVKIGVRNTYYMLRPYQQSDRYIQYGGGNATAMVVDVQDY